MNQRALTYIHTSARFGNDVYLHVYGYIRIWDGDGDCGVNDGDDADTIEDDDGDDIGDNLDNDVDDKDGDVDAVVAHNDVDDDD